MLRLLFLSATLYLIPGAWAQDQVQAAMDGIANAEHASEVAATLRQLPHVHMVRVDPYTRTLLMHVEGGFSMDKPSLNALLQPFGVQVRCWQRRPVGQAPFKQVDAATCGDDHPDQ